MTNVDLFDDLPSVHGAPASADAPIPAAGTRKRHPRKGVSEDKHYRLAMRAAKRLPASDRPVDARRLICHHLRCMLDCGHSSPGTVRGRF
ncbi:MAG: hypothetical protein VX766_12335 [Pseudomonadota bacterium]|nr:hypothetical protein [Pseudomonadota bacterium]